LSIAATVAGLWPATSTRYRSQRVAVLATAVLLLVLVGDSVDYVAPVPSAGVTGADDDRLVSLGNTTRNSLEASRRLSDGAWSSPVSIPGLTNSDPSIYPLSADSWIVTNANNTSEALGWGIGQRTTDGGQTWNAPGDPGVGDVGVIHYKMDAGGRLWALWHNGSSPWTQTNVSYSDDGGDTWSASPVFTFGSSLLLEMARGWKIVTHPTDPNVLAVIGFGKNNFGSLNDWGFIASSQDRGASWTIRHAPEVREGQFTHFYEYDAIMLSSSRIVVSGPLDSNGPTRSIYYSDDLGASLVQAWSATGNKRMTQLFSSGTRIAFLVTTVLPGGDSDTHRLVLSTDSGATFTALALAQELEDFTDADFQPKGFSMSGEKDAIYLANYADPAPTEKRVVRLTPVDSSGGWTDITGELPLTSFGYAGIAVVPR
jgi:hypothetical protein